MYNPALQGYREGKGTQGRLPGESNKEIKTCQMNSQAKMSTETVFQAEGNHGQNLENVKEGGMFEQLKEL